MDIYAWGFNAFRQLAQHTEEDILSPLGIASVDDAQILFVSWCETLILLNKSYRLLGGTSSCLSSTIGLSETSSPDVIPASFFGAHEGIQGCISGTGQLFFLNTHPFKRPMIDRTSSTTSPKAFQRFGMNPDPIKLTHISIAGNSRVVVTFCEKSEGTPHRTYILEFSTVEEFRTWYKSHPFFDTSGKADPLPPTSSSGIRHSFYVIPGLSSQLVSGATSFSLLASTGCIYTWGDSRYVRCLGRPIADLSSASIPTQIPYLSETRVEKIASGSWMSGALSNEGELFIWGQGSPSLNGEIAALRTVRGETDNEDEDEFVKEVCVTIDDLRACVYDFGMGSGHLVVAAGVNDLEKVLKRALFCAGQGESGQLGLGQKLQFLAKLTEVQELSMKRVRSVTCGGNNSFVVVDNLSIA